MCVCVCVCISFAIAANLHLRLPAWTKNCWLLVLFLFFHPFNCFQFPSKSISISIYRRENWCWRDLFRVDWIFITSGRNVCVTSLPAKCFHTHTHASARPIVIISTIRYEIDWMDKSFRCYTKSVSNGKRCAIALCAHVCSAFLLFFSLYLFDAHWHVRNVHETIRTCDQLYQHQAHFNLHRASSILPLIPRVRVHLVNIEIHAFPYAQIVHFDLEINQFKCNSKICLWARFYTLVIISE